MRASAIGEEQRRHRHAGHVALEIDIRPRRRRPIAVAIWLPPAPPLRLASQPVGRAGGDDEVSGCGIAQSRQSDAKASGSLIVATVVRHRCRTGASAARDAAEQMGPILEAGAADDADRCSRSRPASRRRRSSASARPCRARGRARGATCACASASVSLIAEAIDDQRQISAAPRGRGQRAARCRGDQNGRWLSIEARARARRHRENRSRTGFAASIIFWNRPNSVLYLMLPIASGPMPSAPCGVSSAPFAVISRPSTPAGGTALTSATIRQLSAPPRAARCDRMRHAGAPGAQRRLRRRQDRGLLRIVAAVGAAHLDVEARLDLLCGVARRA